ncbi:SDR family oxidoreductase [Streptomyces sp. NPDC058664]|uniref:SDR family oxidoreductase n=1 Tax=unclassified Streptomyces TaxID=2593676 RepID=UPI003650D8DF
MAKTRVRINSAHVIITGGSSGIGLATARLLTARGARVSLVARRPDHLQAAAKALRATGATVAFRAADVADQQALASALAELEEEQGPCDVLITSAGIARPGHFLELPDDVFRQAIEINYFGTLHAIRAIAPGMVKRRHGSIVAVSSTAGLIGVFGYTAYASSKFAVGGLMEALRAELRPHHVHASIVYPPDVDTPLLAEEEQWKPDETRAISSSIKPLHAGKVATAIIAGIERGKFGISADPGTRALARFGNILAPLLNHTFDRRVDTVAKQRHKTQ